MNRRFSVDFEICVPTTSKLAKKSKKHGDDFLMISDDKNMMISCLYIKTNSFVEHHQKTR